MTILFITAHPDDLEILCAGTVAALVKQGFQVVVVILTDGSLGCPGKSLDEARSIRKSEAENACAILGASLASFGLANDGQLRDNEKIRTALAQVIAEIGPEAILTHSSRDYHADHLACLGIVRAATMQSRVGSTSVKIKPASCAPQIFLMDTVSGTGFEPHFYVDITPFWAKKEAALRAHQSQVNLMAGRGKDLVEIARSQARIRGIQSAVKFAEGFQFYNAWLLSQAFRGFPLSSMSQNSVG